jgi:hypothetical protein
MKLSAPESGEHAATSSELYELGMKVAAITTNAAKGFVEQKQAIADNATGTTKALNALKDSTQVAFDAVRGDMMSADKAIQRINARVSALEGGDGVRVDNVVQVRAALASALARISKLEATGQPTNSTSSLEVELRALLTRYGYRADSVGVKKTTYLPIHSIVNHGGLGALPISGGSEVIEIVIGGSKPLTS